MSNRGGTLSTNDPDRVEGGDQSGSRRGIIFRGLSLTATPRQELPAPGTDAKLPAHKREGPLRTVLSFVLFVVIPTLVAAIYYGLIAADRYVAEGRLVVNAQGEASGAAIASLFGGIGMGSSGVGSQGQLLVAFMKSPALLREVERNLDVESIFRHPDADRVSRLPEGAPFEDRFEFFSDMISVEWDGHSRIIELKVRAFAPTDAKLLMDTIVLISEQRLNTISRRQQADSTAFAGEELARAERRLREARAAVNDFRRDNQEIDPAGTAQHASGLLASIASQITQARAELAQLLTYLRADSPQVQGLRAQIAKLEALAREERSRMAGPSDGTLAEKVSRYEELLMEEEFARGNYKAAMLFLDNARTEALRQHSYVIDFAPAAVPEKAVEPHRWRSVLMVFLASLILLALGNLIVSSIREQARL